MNGLLFRVIRADNRRLYSLMVEILDQPDEDASNVLEDGHHGDDA